MNFSAIALTYLSAIIWILPPLKQYKTFFFKYFLILAISDILDILFLNFFKMEFSYLYILISFSLFIALQQEKYLKQKKILFGGFGGVVVILGFMKLGSGFTIFLLTFLHLMIIFRILYLFVMEVAQKQVINFFYLVLTFYEFTILLKFLNFLFVLNIDAHTYFYITTGFELLVGIFFTTFREDSAKLVYKLK